MYECVCMHVCACVQVCVSALHSMCVHVPAVIGSDGNKCHRFGLLGPFRFVPPHRFPGAAFSPCCSPFSPAHGRESCVLIPSQAFPLGVSSQENKESNYSLFGE